MGLDMYAVTVKNELVKDQPEYGVPIEKIVLKAVGYVPPADPESLSPEEREFDWYTRSGALTRAVEEGLYNPEFAYWRKFHHLHGWMEQLYREKCPPAEQESFNCITLRLREQDLARLEQEASGLVPTPGFFFGRQEPLTPEDVQDIIEFVNKSRKAIAEGYAVFYDSWW
jgi:hypothetical protein